VTHMPDPLTERRGVNAVEAVFLNDFKWIFREQAVSDFGIDAQAEVVEFDKPTGAHGVTDQDRRVLFPEARRRLHFLRRAASPRLLAGPFAAGVSYPA
jgi:Domain of unknown function (DUF4365)